MKMLAIEKRSYPLQEKLLDAKTSEERKALRRQIKALKYVHLYESSIGFVHITCEPTVNFFKLTPKSYICLFHKKVDKRVW